MIIKAEYPEASKIVAEFSAKANLSDKEKRLLEFYSKNSGDRVSDAQIANRIGANPVYVCQMRSRLRNIGAISTRKDTIVLNYAFMNRATPMSRHEKVRKGDATRAKKKSHTEILRELIREELSRLLPAS